MDRIALFVRRLTGPSNGRGIARLGAVAATALFVAAASACGTTSLTDSADEAPDAIADQPDPVTSSDEVPPSATQIPSAEVDTLFRSSSSGITASRRQVIRDADELESVWTEATSHVVSDSGMEVPDVDFASAQVLLLAMGERSSGGYSIEAGAMAVSGDTLYVAVEEVSPGPSCMTTMALTQPVTLLAVPSTATAVMFVESTSILDCS